MALGLGVEADGIEQVGQGGGACPVEDALHTQVLFGRCYRCLGDVDLLVGLFEVVPCCLNVYRQFLLCLLAYPMIVRCHRTFLVNLQQVELIISKSGTVQLLIKHCHDYLPVSRSNIAQIKEALRSPSSL